MKTSPRKLRLVADVVRSLEPNKAIELLPHTNKRAALPLQKVIKSAVANAVDRGVAGNLIIKEIQVNEGPRLKRGRAVSRGRWHPYQRKMSHVRIVLETVEDVAESTKADERSRNKVRASQSTKSKRDDAADMKSLSAASKSDTKKDKQTKSKLNKTVFKKRKEKKF